MAACSKYVRPGRANRYGRDCTRRSWHPPTTGLSSSGTVPPIIFLRASLETDQPVAGRHSRQSYETCTDQLEGTAGNTGGAGATSASEVLIVYVSVALVATRQQISSLA